MELPQSYDEYACYCLSIKSLTRARVKSGRASVKYSFYPARNPRKPPMPGDKTIMPNGVSADGTTFVKYQGGTDATEFSVPDGLVKIGRAFADCKGLETVVIPSSVAEIENTAFRDAQAVTVVAPKGSFAEEFAKKRKMKFKPLE